MFVFIRSHKENTKGPAKHAKPAGTKGPRQACSPRSISPFRHTPQSVSRMRPIASSDTERDPGSTIRPSYLWQSVDSTRPFQPRLSIAHSNTQTGPDCRRSAMSCHIVPCRAVPCRVASCAAVYRIAYCAVPRVPCVPSIFEPILMYPHYQPQTGVSQHHST